MDSCHWQVWGFYDLAHCLLCCLAQHGTKGVWGDAVWSPGLTSPSRLPQFQRKCWRSARQRPPTQGRSLSCPPATTSSPPTSPCAAKPAQMPNPAPQNARSRCVSDSEVLCIFTSRKLSVCWRMKWLFGSSPPTKEGHQSKLRMWCSTSFLGGWSALVNMFDACLN